jgi:hypothetical protein
MKIARSIVVTLLGLSGFLIASAGAATVHATGYSNYTCHGGSISPGDYGPTTIVGACSVDDGTVRIHGNLTVRPQASFAATSATQSVRVLGQVYVNPNAAFFFGCSYDGGCNPPFPEDTIQGSLSAGAPLGVVLAGAVILHGFTEAGGGGGVNCSYNALFGGPAFSTIADSTIGGSVQIRGLRTCWFGIDSSDIGGSVTVNSNTSADPDSTEISSNNIGGNLSCGSNSPAPHLGEFSPTNNPNNVDRLASGQCAGLST